LKTPKPLKQGSTIGLISTARKIDKETLKPAVELFESWGLKTVFSQHLFEEDHQFAGSDEQRLADLQSFIDDPQIEAVMCVRGGYGTVRIVDELNFLSLTQKPKWICGYSDVTVLLNKLQRKGLESLHSTMPIDFHRVSETGKESLRRVLFGETLAYEVEGHPFNKKGETHGRLMGGNLSVLYSQTGSPSSLNTEGAILFIEDLDEYLYHIDRMMQNLKRNGYFERLSGMIVGGMTDMHDNKIPFGRNAKEIISDILRPYNFPLCFDFPAGHQDDNRALIFGRRVRLDVGSRVKLVFEDGTT
jgi:muramoyltetrapeptide carboxypeptidase